MRADRDFLGHVGRRSLFLTRLAPMPEALAQCVCVSVWTVLTALPTRQLGSRRSLAQGSGSAQAFCLPITWLFPFLCLAA